jgi:hypothetical protein
MHRQSRLQTRVAIFFLGLSMSVCLLLLLADYVGGLMIYFSPYKNSGTDEQIFM